MNHPIDLINAHIRQHSNLDLHRPYVGMSSINRCARFIYNQFLHGTEPLEIHYRKSYQGYMYEREAKKILAACGLFRPGSERELTASWDSRFRGHTEGEDCEGNLMEIKSLNAKRYGEIKETGKVTHPMFWQLQAYMLHGDYRKCTVYLINTEVFEFNTITVLPNKVTQDRAEMKAAEILAAIDSNTPPACLCGKCN